MQRILIRYYYITLLVEQKDQRLKCKQYNLFSVKDFV